MVVFRIALTKYAQGLVSSGRAARWNLNESKVIYTSATQSLACLENVVHRSKLGLSANFSVLYIDIPTSVNSSIINLADLPKNWNAFENLHQTQALGNQWVKANETAVLRVPSSIIPEEYNYLINVNHPDFKLIKLMKTTPFLFDDGIKY